MNLLNRFIVTSMPILPRPIVQHFANRYIAGDNREDALQLIHKLNQSNIIATCDLLGESTNDPEVAHESMEEYLNLISDIAKRNLRSGISLKLTQLGLLLGKELCLELVGKIVAHAKDHDIFMRIDMEDSSVTSATLEIYHTLQKRYGNLGCAIQSYLRRSINDIEVLSKEKANIRICKGIYIEPRTIAYKDPRIINKSYRYIIEKLLLSGCPTAIATHDEWIVWAALELIDRHKIPAQQYEFQMLLGVDHQLRDIIVSQGHRLRIYIPYGKRWFAYTRRRFKENPKIASYVFRNIFNSYKTFETS